MKLLLILSDCVLLSYSLLLLLLLLLNDDSQLSKLIHCLTCYYKYFFVLLLNYSPSKRSFTVTTQFALTTCETDGSLRLQLCYSQNRQLLADSLTQINFCYYQHRELISLARGRLPDISLGARDGTVDIDGFWV